MKFSTSDIGQGDIYPAYSFPYSDPNHTGQAINSRAL